MHLSAIPRRCLPALLFAGLAACLSVPAHASEPHAKTGSVIVRMCKSADKVKMLSAMCNSYVDGYLDAAQQLGKGRPFCVNAADRAAAPGAIVAWIDAHPEALTQPAAGVMHQALAERFPCPGKR